MGGSDRSSELRLPTTAVGVRLAMVSGAPQHTELFVADIPGRSRSQLVEDVAAMLDAAAGFIPVRSSTRVRLLGKHAIAWIAIRRRDPEENPAAEEQLDFTLYDRQHRVELELAHGTKLIGTMLDSSPSDRPRVIDHLNRAGRFVRLWTTDEHYLINTTQVVAVTELPEGK